MAILEIAKAAETRAEASSTLCWRLMWDQELQSITLDYAVTRAAEAWGEAADRIGRAMEELGFRHAFDRARGRLEYFLDAVPPLNGLTGMQQVPATISAIRDHAVFLPPEVVKHFAALIDQERCKGPKAIFPPEINARLLALQEEGTRDEPKRRAKKSNPRHKKSSSAEGAGNQEAGWTGRVAVEGAESVRPNLR